MDDNDWVRDLRWFFMEQFLSSLGSWGRPVATSSLWCSKIKVILAHHGTAATPVLSTQDSCQLWCETFAWWAMSYSPCRGKDFSSTAESGDLGTLVPLPAVYQLFWYCFDAKRCRFQPVGWGRTDRCHWKATSLIWSWWIRVQLRSAEISWVVSHAAADAAEPWVKYGEVFAKCVWMCLVLLFAVKCLPRSSKWLALHMKLVIPQPRPWGQRHSRLWMGYLYGFFGESNSTFSERTKRHAASRAAHGFCYLPVHLVLV